MDSLVPPGTRDTRAERTLTRSHRKGDGIDSRPAGRLLYLDNLKVLLIAGIIAGHGLVSYGALELWSYAGVRETTLSPVTEALLSTLLAPFGLFMIPLLFLVAGLCTPPSIERKGPARYARDRLARLGIPFVAFVGLIWPAVLYALYRPFGKADGSYWQEFIGTREESLDTGYFWFVGDLLLFSLAYAMWVRLREARRASHPNSGTGRPREIRLGHLLVIAGVVAVTTFLVRLSFPVESERYVDLDLYQWPAAIALFGIGVTAARSEWLTAIPHRLAAQSRRASLLAAGAFGAFIAVGFALGGVGEETWAGGWHWEAFGFATFESILAVFGPVWILSVAQRRLNRGLVWAPPAAGRSSYGAFVIQGLFLIGLAVALRPLPLVAEIKATVVAIGGVTGSFAGAWLLIRHVPAMARLL